MNETQLQHAKQLENDEKWADAADQYIQIINDAPSSSLYERVAWCLSRAGKYKDSIEYLYKLHENEPLSAKWLYMIGYQYYCQKDWEQAIIWFEKALDKYQDYFVVKYRLAYAYIQRAGIYKQLTKAEYWKALDQLKDCHRLWETFDVVKKQKERNTYFDINFLHGKVLMGLPKHRNEAINRFQFALEIKPTDEFAKYELAKTYYLNGDYEKAKKNIPLNNQYFTLELAAYTDAKLGDYTKAIATISNLIKSRNKDYLYCFLAEINLINSNLEEAYKMAQKAVTLGKNNHKNYFTLAKVYFEYGLLNKANEYLDRANKIKRTKYETSYEECDTLRELILSKMPLDYQDDDVLLAKLHALNTPQFVKGTICRYNTGKGFGFIKSDTRDIFFHISNCNYTDVSVGDYVQFKTITNDKGVMAVELRKLN